MQKCNIHERPFCARIAPPNSNTLADHGFPSCSSTLNHSASGSAKEAGSAGFGRTAVCTMTSFEAGSTRIIWPRIPSRANLRGAPGRIHIGVTRNTNCPLKSAGIGPNRKSKTRNNRLALVSGERHNPCSHRNIDMHLLASIPAIDVRTVDK